MSFPANGLTMDGTSNVMRRTKGSATKTTVSCPNIIRMYNASIGGVNVIDQKMAAYGLNCKSKIQSLFEDIFRSH